MKRQLSNIIYSLKFAMEKNDFERLESSSGKKRNDFFANPIVSWALPIKAPNLMYEIGMSLYQYWHQVMHF